MSKTSTPLICFFANEIFFREFSFEAVVSGKVLLPQAWKDTAFSRLRPGRIDGESVKVGLQTGSTRISLWEAVGDLKSPSLRLKTGEGWQNKKPPQHLKRLIS